jgi:hypothetical protein
MLPEREVKGGAFAGLRVCPDAAAVAVDHSLHDRESDARPGILCVAV